MAAHDRKKGKQTTTAANTDNSKNDSTITPLPKRSKGKRSRKKQQSFLDLASQTVTNDGPLIPMDPVERYAWDRMWDMLYDKMLPLVIERVQAKMYQERQQQAA